MGKKEFTYTLQIDAEIQDLIAKTAKVKQSMQNIMSSGKAPGAEKAFEGIERAIDRLQQKTAQPIDSLSAFKGIQKDAAAIGLSLSRLGEQIDNLSNLSDADKIDLLPADAKKRIQDVQTALAAFESTTAAAAQKSQDLVDAERDLASAEKALRAAQGKVSDKQQLITLQSRAVDESKAEADAIKDKIDALKKYQSTLAAYESAGGNKSAKGDSKANEGKGLEGLNLPADRKAASAAMPEGLDLKSAADVESAIAQLTAQYTQASKAVTDAESIQRKYTKELSNASNNASVAQTKVNDLKGTVDGLNAEFEQNKAKAAADGYSKLRTEAEKLGVDLTDIPIDYTEDNLKQLREALERVKTEGIDTVTAGCNVIQQEFSETSDSSDRMRESLERNKETAKELDDRMNQTQAFANRIKQFVGIEGAARLARKAFQDAFKTIKELDAAMTEMAVVTELDVGDYWNKLPEYTERANALGVSIKSAYESATLYYQQGLKTNEVVAMSNETLKMARIAGLSAEDATNKMTAALRGFNMELNETSAQKISDVYSKLAAITASDVNEISTAMTKTASIAASAGMEFETTAAFLSQIIETTRESAETAGTAMKTVIARFQELKKDPAEIGEVDGEIVDANKIETALRSVGVSLRDSSGQFRELDDVFLELSSKWNTLDTNTQRYIATIAAGSRQQSRFIAMMSDYSRTQELVSAANNSAGASNEQFAKTLDSLESKLNQLKNSWDTFTMSLMDSTFLKMGIDLLNGIMTAINGVIAAFDKVGLGGAASLGMVIGALALGTKLLNAFELNMRATDATGKKLYTTLGAIGQTAKQSFAKLISSIKNLRTLMIKTFSAKLNVKIDSKAMNTATKAFKDHQKATGELATIEKARAKAAREGTLTDARAAQLSQEAADATSRKSAAEKELMATMGLSAAQMAGVNDIMALNNAASGTQIGLDHALILSKAGVSAQTLTQAAAAYSAKAGNDALTASEYGVQLAEKLQNASGIRALSTRIALTIANWAQTASEGAKTGSIWANITATIAQTMANWGLQGSMWPILVIGLLLIAAIALLALVIWAVVSAIKAFIKNSPEGQLKAAEEAAEEAGKAAEQAAEAYQNLSDSFDSLADKYSALEELTEGTREWRDAVKEINGEVMDLVEQYPELANLVTNENGVLKIDVDSEEAQAVLDSYEQKSIQASSAEMAAKIEVAEKQKVVAYKNLSDQATITNEFANVMGYIGSAFLLAGGSAMPGGQLAGIEGIQAINNKKAEDKADTEALAKALADGLLLQDEQGHWKANDEQALADLGLTTEEAEKFANALGEGAEELKEYGKTINELNERQKAYLQGLATNASQLVDTSGMTDEQIQQVYTAADDNYAGVFRDRELTRLEGLSDDDFQSEMQKVAQQIYGDSAEVDKNGDVTYADADGNEKTISREQFEDQAAAAMATDQMADALEDLPKAIDRVGRILGDAGKSFEKTYAKKEGGGLTQADLKNLSGLTKEQLSDAYWALSSEEKSAFGSEENFHKHIEESQKLAEAAFENAKKKVTDMGAVVEFHENMGSEAAKGYAEQLVDIASSSGQAGVDAVNSAINNIASGLTDSQLDAFMAQVNALDWKNIDSLESLPGILSELGIAVPEEALSNFIEVAKDAAGAIHDIDLDKLGEQIQQLASISNKIETNQQDRVFSDSDYNTIVSADSELASDFVQDLDGNWVYVGESMDKLRQAIEDNTSALLGEAIDQLGNKVNSSEVMTGMSGTYGDITKWAEWDTNATRTWLAEFITRAVAQGLDLSMLDIDGLSNQTAAMKISEEKLTEIMTGLHTVFAQTGTNLDKLNEKILQSAGTEYQTRNATENSAYATALRRTATSRTLSPDEITELTARQNALIAQATSAGVDNITITNYTKIIEKIYEMIEAGKTGTEEFKQLVNQAESLEVVLTNATGLGLMNDRCERTISTISELNELMKKAVDWDTKLMYLANAVSGFGIDVYKLTRAEQEYLMTLINTMVQGGTEGYLAMDQLLVLAAQSMGITMEQLANLGTTTFSEMLETNQTNLITFLNNIRSLGLGDWFDLPDGSGSVFKFMTPGQYQTNIQESEGEEHWVSSYNYMYNYNEQINALIREREKLERAYKRAVDDSTKSVKELQELMVAETGNLSDQIDMYKAGITKAQASIRQLFTDNPEFAKYVSFDATTGTIKIDDTALAQVQDSWSSEKGEKFENFLAALEENRDVIVEGLAALDDIEDQVVEIKKRTREQASNLYDSVKEGLIKERQDEIDKLSEINDSINETQSKLVEQIQKQIDDARQARENEQTEQNIADKEARLAYLMRDTSGNHTAEILALQKDLDEEKQGYADNLVDQKLNDLTEANEAAAAQRERQITLLQAQLDAYSNSQTVWQDVKAILDESYTQAEAAVASGKTWDEAWNATQAGRFQNIAADTATLNPVAREMQKEDNAEEAKEAKTYLDQDSYLWKQLEEVEEKVKEAKEDINAANETLNGTTNTNLTNGTTLVAGSMNNVGTKIDGAARTISNEIQGQTSILKSAIDGSKINIDSILAGLTGGDSEKEQARRAVQEYIDTHGMTESSRSTWFQDPGYAKLLDKYVKLGGSESDLRGATESTPENPEDNLPKGKYLGYGTDAAGLFEESIWPYDVSSKEEDGWLKVNGTKSKVRVHGNQSVSQEVSDALNRGLQEVGVQPYVGNSGGAGNKWQVGFYKDNYYMYTSGGWKKLSFLKGEKFPVYKTGGLADFTGPAWLDGTKSSPELVLNSTDTRNFIILKDILGDILQGTSTIKRQSDTDTKGGDNYYEIEINVDSLNEDYDVEQLADKIKSMIYEDSVYRNVNTVHLIR